MTKYFFCNSLESENPDVVLVNPGTDWILQSKGCVTMSF
jgi:hypothetical protein